ncbi:MAG: ParB/RepB/Spo0J family partition protein [Xanthobacteraceae bacterium]
MTITTQSIPLNKLIPWSGNVRRTDAGADIEELAASIASHGLLNPLLIRKDKRGKFAVIAGQRRLLALQRLAASERIDSDFAVDCRFVDDAASPAELSLTENVVRTAMHPADEFEAFRDLVDAGSDIAAIAARFGIAESRAEKRLRLGRLSPVILDAYRKGDLGLEEAMAFTLGADHDTQERVFADLPPWRCKPSSIRAALTPGEIPASDPRVKLVGLDAYAQAGGTVRRDLFDDENAGYVQDVVLLDSLTMARLHEAAKPVEAEGWSWVECAIALDWSALSRFSRVHPVRDALSPPLQAELDDLQARFDDLADNEDDEAEQSRDAIGQRIEQIEASAERWTQDALSIAGAVLTVDRDGEIEVRRGLVRPSDASKAKKARKATPQDKQAGDKPLPSTLVAELSAQKTAALAATLMKRPDAALAVTVHALALDAFYDGAEESCLRLRLDTPDLDRALFDAEACKAAKALAAEHERWRKRLPKDASKLFAWCLEQKRAVLLDLLAVLAACSIDAVIGKGRLQTQARLAHADALGAAIALNLASWYRPGADTYFARVSRSSILDAIEEATGKKPAPAWQKLKRPELATKAAKLVASTNWLPAPLRNAGNHASDPAALPEAAE